MQVNEDENYEEEDGVVVTPRNKPKLPKSKVVDFDNEDDDFDKEELPIVNKSIEVDDDDFDDESELSDKVVPASKPNKPQSKVVDFDDDDEDEDWSDYDKVLPDDFDALDDHDLDGYGDEMYSDDSFDVKKKRPLILDPNDEKEFVNLVKLTTKRLLSDEEFTKDITGNEIDSDHIAFQILKRGAIKKYIKKAELAKKFYDLPVRNKEEILEIALPTETIKFRSESSAK